MNRCHYLLLLIPFTLCADRVVDVHISPHTSIWQNDPPATENLWVECSLINPTETDQNISILGWPSNSPSVDNDGVKANSPLPTTMGPYTETLAQGESYNIRWQSSSSDPIPRLLRVTVSSTDQLGHVLGRCLIWYRQTDTSAGHTSSGAYDFPMAQGNGF